MTRFKVTRYEEHNRLIVAAEAFAASVLEKPR